MGAKLLEIDATAIKFVCEVKKQSTSSVHLSNISDEYVAFKVKTTSPKRFCVRPNSGIISPKSACDFTVTMQGLRSNPSEVECKDKFLIQSTVVDAATKEEEVTLELFSKRSGKYVEEKKLMVVLVSKQDSSSEEDKNKVSGKEPTNVSLTREENAVKLGKKPSNESSVKEENVVKTKVLGKEPSNESSMKEKNVVKKDENALPSHTQTKDRREVKDGNEGNLSKNLTSNPVNVVKEDPERKLRLCKQLRELKLKEATLENQLKEAKSTISSLTCQNSIINEAKETLKLELARRSKKGYPFVFVCIVSIIGLISGYISDP
ncbi:hypothetical protein M8C21_016519 [Ambrosia artemisiifolia]|uniref:MSP domain-containing protein n=1 Tax=Ambrosia artemisiifolia TaxID=4212 RepID=A0AAD5DAS6_AMBAR|nr:hypothetical protein M8C21_016519 [Ambrosia artemisiifolia]